MELTEGIILKTIKYQENSKIAYILTKEGLVTVLIRASLEYKSKNFAYSQELTKIEFDISRSKKNSFDILSSGRCINSYLNLKKDYNTLLDVSNIIELAYKSAEHVINNSNLYDLLDFYLDKYNEYYESEHVRFYSVIFKLKLLYLLGIGLNFSKCLICSKDVDFYNCFYSIDLGGSICDKCKVNVKDLFYGDYIKIIKIIYLAKLDKLSHELITQFPLECYSDILEFLKRYYNKYL